jgi:hypothetical protein
MRLPRGAEILLDADVELLGAALKPQPATERERRWLGHLAETEQLAEEAARLGLAASGCGRLHMVDSLEWVGLRHRARSVSSSADRRLRSPRRALVELIPARFDSLW